MDIPFGSWSGGQSQATPAALYDIRYGTNILNEESKCWPPYFIVTSPSALKSTASFLSKPPVGYNFTNSLDWVHLEYISSLVPKETKLIIAIGGGIVLDAGKYISLKTSIPLVLVPTIVSTGAIIHSVFAKWEGFSTVGSPDSWPWLNAHHVIVDYSVILDSPFHLNTAGLGDILCSQAGISEWNYSFRTKTGPPVDSSIILPVLNQRYKIVKEFPPTLDNSNRLTAKSIKFIVKSIQQRDANSIKSPYAPGSDHVFWQCVESTNNKGWIHGAGVALSAVIVAWHSEEGVDQLIEDLDLCKVLWRPSQIGISKDHLELALRSAPKFFSDKNNGRDIKSILRINPIQGKRFNYLWDFLQN